MSTKCLIWFRQDLRIRDNLTLSSSVRRRVAIAPIFILDPAVEIGSCSKYWLFHSLKSLNNSLNNTLQVYHGDTSEIIDEILKENDFSEISWNKMYDDKSKKIEEKVKNIAKKHQLKSYIYNSSLLLEPSKTLKKDGTPYKVFTPFYRQNFLNRKYHADAQAIDGLELITSSAANNLNSLKDILAPKKDSWMRKFHNIWEPGEDSAHKKLEEFLKIGINDYEEGRNRPDKINTSRLSPHIHFGEISVNKISSCLNLNNKNHERYFSELVWREFSHNLLHYNPELPKKNLQHKFNNFPWINNKSHLKKWQRGLTGYPIVDAGMRELWETGYMHNRVRMIVGSFLVKNLMIHWKYGLEWFSDTLMDADIANNSASWQWVAGTGADAAPYFRIFNPITQGQKFDPEGLYVRKFIPEISNLPNKYIHFPSDCPTEIIKQSGVILGKTYPFPMVELKYSRERALLAFKNLNKINQSC